MSSSLAEQLQKLVVPQTSVLKQDKSKPSLLFDKKHAAEISREVFYQIGLDGFEELKSKSPLFAPFENTLFHVTSKEYERSVQDAVANERLNKHIKKFFYVLSPYLSLICAHKALEWLINRYRIHEYNRNDFLMLILPYHETNIFVRALQLVKIKDSGDHFIWLKEVQRTGVHLSKGLLYTYAARNPLFLKEIGEFMLQTLKEQNQPHTVNILFKFYCTTVTGALEYSNEINETHISPILNVLLKGYKSTVADFCAGSYIITTKLLSKTELSEKILNKFVINISHMNVDYLHREAILVLVVLYQTQTHFSEMSYSAVKHLANKVETVNILGKLNCVSNFINPLLEPLLKGLIENGILEAETSEIHTFLLTLLSEVRLEDSIVYKLMSYILEAYENQRKNVTDNIYNWLVSIVSTIEIQYPVVFDKEANILMKVQQGEKFTKKQKCFQKLIVNCGKTGRNIGMFSKLYHPVAGIRKEATKYYIKLYKDLEDKEKELIRNIIIEKINDESPDVVLETLQHSKKLLLQLADNATLQTRLISLLKKGSAPGWKKILHPTLEILCHISNGDDVVVFAALLPYLLPLGESDMKIAMLILNSCYSKTCKFLQGLDIKKLKDTISHEILFDTVINNFHSLRLDITKLIETLESDFIKGESIPSKYIIITLLHILLPEQVSIDISCKILDILIANISDAKLFETDCSLKSNFLAAKQNKFSVRGVIDCINILIKRTDFSTYTFESCDLAGTSEETKFLIRVLDVLLTGCYSAKYGDANPFPNGCKQFLNHFFGNLQSKLEFLFNVCIADTKEIAMSLRIRSLRTIYALIKKEGQNISINEIIVACLLINLSNKNKQMRIWTINTIAVILKCMKSKSEVDYIVLLKSVLNYKEEIIVDNNQISTITNNVFENITGVEGIQVAVSKLVALANNKNVPFYLRGYLTNILIAIDDFEIYNKLSHVAVELLEKNKDNTSALNELSSICLYNMLTTLDIEKSSKLQISSNSFHMLEMLIHNNSLTITYENNDIIPSILTIAQVQNIFEYLASDVKPTILNCVIEVAAGTSNPDLVTAARKFFKHIDLDIAHINQQISEMCDVLQPEHNVSKRQKRVSIPTADVLETRQWKKGIIVFEFIQDKKKIRNSELLIPFLFKILKKCLDFDEQLNVEYPKQLILSILLNCCTKLKETNVSENIFNVEVLVQCIRMSQNPQTHHHALLVLAYAANSVPEQVLHHMMAIFTFMGSSVLRHDDSYSFQIIYKIIDTIIPILVKDNSLNNIVNVLRVFVDAILDVPEHRRITLYCNLIEKLGAKSNIYLFTLLMLEAYVLHANVEKQKAKSASLKNSIAPKRLDVTADIIRRFPPDIAIESCIELLMFLQKLSETKEEITAQVNLPFDITHQTPKQYRHFKYAIISFVSNLLSSQEFVCIIANLDDENQQKLETIYKDMIINTITFIQSIAKTADKNKNTSQSHYWKMILHHSYDVLDSINRLLTPHMFLLVIRGLTTHRLNHIRRRSLELLNTKLQHDTQFFGRCTKSEIYEIVPALLNIIRQEQSDENQLTVQTAFLSLKLFIRFFAGDHLDKLVNVLIYLTDFIKNTKIHGNILASAILCLAELCYHLRAHAISNINKFMPTLLKIVKIHRQDNQPDLLLLSTVTAILKILESLPLFLSSYIEKLLFELSLMSSKWKNPDDSRVQPIATKLSIIKEKIGKLVPFRVLLPAISNTYYQLIEDKNYSSVVTLTDIMSEKISHLSSSEIQSNMSELTTLFLNMLHFRADNLTSLVETNETEKHIIDAVNTFVLKLSESAFRPLYYKMYDWAVRHDVKNERVITFYALSSTISENLKSLFVLFAGHILNNAALLLNLCNVSKEQELYYENEEKALLLLEYVLKTLLSIFLYDTRRFIDKERFDLLMQPIVDQLENELGGNESIFISRTENLVIPCIVQLAVATGDDALWKQLNYQVLLKMRHSSETIRILALKCLLELAIKLGADFLPLLPETIPFLAELLEDENQDVEHTCQRTVQELEKILGEPLQKYF